MRIVFDFIVFQDDFVHCCQYFSDPLTLEVFRGA